MNIPFFYHLNKIMNLHIIKCWAPFRTCDAPWIPMSMLPTDKMNVSKQSYVDKLHRYECTSLYKIDFCHLMPEFIYISNNGHSRVIGKIYDQSLEKFWT